LALSRKCINEKRKKLLFGKRRFLTARPSKGEAFCV